MTWQGVGGEIAAQGSPPRQAALRRRKREGWIYGQTGRGVTRQTPPMRQVTGRRVLLLGQRLTERNGRGVPTQRPPLGQQTGSRRAHTQETCPSPGCRPHRPLPLPTGSQLVQRLAASPATMGYPRAESTAAGAPLLRVPRAGSGGRPHTDSARAREGTPGTLGCLRRLRRADPTAMPNPQGQGLQPRGSRPRSRPGARRHQLETCGSTCPRSRQVARRVTPTGAHGGEGLAKGLAKGLARVLAQFHPARRRSRGRRQGSNMQPARPAGRSPRARGRGRALALPCLGQGRA